MALDIFFKADLRAKTLAGLVLVITTAQAEGNTNVEFVRGAVAIARYDIQYLGYSWPEFVKDAQRALAVTESFGSLPGQALR